MPMELAVPAPEEGAGLLFIATASFSKVHPARIVAFAAEVTNAVDPIATAARTIARFFLLTNIVLPSQVGICFQIEQNS
jgi:hypothetical protein